MASAKNKRASRGSESQLAELNADIRERNLRHELRLSERKMKKLLRRFKAGLLRTPSHKKVWDDSRKNIVKTLDIIRPQGYAPDSPRHGRALAHLAYLKDLLEK